MEYATEQKTAQNNGKLKLDVLKDNSEGRYTSHALIHAKVVESPKYFSTRLYIKDEIHTLFRPYDLRYIQSYARLKLNDCLFMNT